MHSILELGANVPAFLAKLWRLVDDPDTNDLICWSEDGTSFYIRDQAQFSRKLLPMYYKHNNMASFIRQLNMYGFHKIVAADAGSLRLDRDEMEFAHQCFLRGHPYLLEHIKRKNQLLSNKQLDESRVSSSGGTVVRADIMNKLLNEVKHMRGRQETVETRLSNMKQENEALWRELSLLRQKHMKQQTIVNKLIQFLVTLVQPSQRLNTKRRYPLMINNVAHPTNETKGAAKAGANFADVNSNASQQGRRMVTIVLPTNQAQPSSTTIHEVDSDMIINDAEELLDPSITLADPSITLADPSITLADPSITLADPSITLADPEEELSNLPGTDDLSSSVILGELTDNLNTGTLLSLEEEEQATQGVGSNLAASPVEVSVASVANVPEGKSINILPSDILLGVDPSEVNPAIIVPGLQKKKMQQKAINQAMSAARPQVISTRSSSGDLLANKGNSNGNVRATGAAPQSYASKTTAAAAAAAVEKAVAAIKKEPRITSNRSRKRKTSQAKQPAQNLIVQSSPETMEPVDLLAEVGLVSPAPQLLAEQTSDPMTRMGMAVSSPDGCAPPMSPVVVFPISEPSESGSPAPPTSPYMTEMPCRNSNVMEGSPMSASAQGAGASSPLVVYPAKSPMSPMEMMSPSDLALACTSQDNSGAVSASMTQSPDLLNRCANNNVYPEELDVHCDTLDSELVQLKDLLHNSGFSLDASTLLGLFNPDDSLPFNFQPDNEGRDHLVEDPMGNELTMYGVPEDFPYLDRRPDSSSPPLLGDGCDMNTPVLTPASPGFNVAMADAKRRKV